MNKPELQSRILANSAQLFNLSSAIDKLPNSDTKDELVGRLEHTAFKLATLKLELEEIDRDACYYGYIDKCPGGVCCECKYLLGGE